jgi:hypothetical protein
MSASSLETLRGGPHSDQPKHWLRILLFIYVIVAASPIRYWQIRDADADCTWLFMLNYGAAHGWQFGRDLLWTNGPLGYLSFPQNIGHNLLYGLAFQLGFWIVLAAIFHDLFFRHGISLPRLGLFSAALGLASPLFWFNRNSDSLFLLGTLVLLLLFQFYGGMIRYCAALIIVGVAPFIKLTGGLAAALAVAGFVLNYILIWRWKAWRVAILGVLVPLTVSALLLVLTVPSVLAFERLARGGWELLGNYGAMSQGGSSLELLAAFFTVAAIAAVLSLADERLRARFYFLLLFPPLLFLLKHGFVRQTDHSVNFFSFALLTLGLIVLQLNVRQWQKYLALSAAAIAFACNAHQPTPFRLYVIDATGLRLAKQTLMACRSLIWAQTAEQERALLGNNAPKPAVPPEMRDVIQQSSVAFLSVVYTGAYFDNLNLRTFPSIQKYSAYTPSLDQMNAEWIRDHGPRFFVFDGTAVDDHHPWAETPAIWMELLRNYRTRMFTGDQLLLERRPVPRFSGLRSVGSEIVFMPGRLELPSPAIAGFWSLSCATNAVGKLRRLLLRPPPATLTVERDDRVPQTYRNVPEVLSAPVLGASLPGDLREFAEVFEDNSSPDFRNRSVVFGGPGAETYGPICVAHLLQPVK